MLSYEDKTFLNITKKLERTETDREIKRDRKEKDTHTHTQEQYTERSEC